MTQVRDDGAGGESMQRFLGGKRGRTGRGGVREKPSKVVGVSFLPDGLSQGSSPRRGKAKGTGQPLGWARQGCGVPLTAGKTRKQFPDTSQQGGSLRSRLLLLHKPKAAKFCRVLGCVRLGSSLKTQPLPSSALRLADCPTWAPAWLVQRLPQEPTGLQAPQTLRSCPCQYGVGRRAVCAWSQYWFPLWILGRNVPKCQLSSWALRGQQ